MKNIKKLITALSILLSLFTAKQAYAQFETITPTYPGTWQYVNGGQTFIVKLWQEGNVYKGHYKMLQTANGTIINNSRKNTPNGDFYPQFAIYTGKSDEYGLTGFVGDNTIPGHDDHPISGNLQIKINPFITGCQTCIVTAVWTVEPTGDMVVGIKPPHSVPLTATLTKVSDTITLD